LIESKTPKEVLEEIKQGKYKKEIDNQKTSTDPEKKALLDAFFADLSSKQEAAKKAEEAEKTAAEEAKAAAAVAGASAGTATAATPAAAKTATPVVSKPAAAKK
jgi:hypothetical protein